MKLVLENQPFVNLSVLGMLVHFAGKTHPEEWAAVNIVMIDMLIMTGHRCANNVIKSMFTYRITIKK